MGLKDEKEDLVKCVTIGRIDYVRVPFHLKLPANCFVHYRSASDEVWA